MKDHITLDELGALLGGRVEAIQPIGEPMIEITREYLQAEINSLLQQRTNAQQAMKNAEAVMHGAEGAIQAYSALLNKMGIEAKPTGGADEPFKDFDAAAEAEQKARKQRRNGVQPEMTGAAG